MTVMKIQRVTALPGTIDPSTFYVVKNADPSFVDLYFSSTNGLELRRITSKQDIDSAIAAGAPKLTTARNIAMTGDVAWNVNFDGTGNVTATGTLANSGVTAGTYAKVTVDAKGRVTAGNGLLAADIPVLDWSKITTGKPTTLGGYGITDAYTTTQIDTLLQGLKPKTSVVVATTGNITLSGLQSIDGVTVAAGDRVLVKNQLAPAENGIYLAATGAWTRATDGDTWTELVSAYMMVQQGSTLADTGWVCTIDPGGTLGTTAVTLVQFSGSGAYAATVHTHTISQITDIANASVATAAKLTAARTISITGDASWSTTFDGSGNVTAAITLANSGVTAGTYPKVTVNAKGLVTGGAALLASDIPSLDAAIITTGTFSNARTTATNANTANAIVSRDASGNFSAGTITANLSGTATDSNGVNLVVADW